MEQQKIGKFIHDLRKEKELTQKQLADLVGVSDKTISKWETGRGIPDTAIMNELCMVLGISVNELLSGERLSEDNYNGKAEENMVNLLKDTERQMDKKKWSIINIVLSLLWILLLVAMFAILGLVSTNILWFIDTSSLILIVGFLILCLGISGQMKDFGMGLKAVYVRENVLSKVQLEKAEHALDFGIKIVLMTGVITALISFVTIMAILDEPYALGPNLAVATLTVLYGVVLSMVLLIFKARVHNRIKDLEEHREKANM